jgi:hypothetical protein
MCLISCQSGYCNIYCAENIYKYSFKIAVPIAQVEPKLHFINESNIKLTIKKSILPKWQHVYIQMYTVK